MNLSRLSLFPALLLLGGCASQSADAPAEIKVYANKSDLAGCERLSGVEVRFDGGNLSFQTKKAIEHLGGNTLLLPSVPASGGQGEAGIVRVAGTSGTAYRCPVVSGN